MTTGHGSLRVFQMCNTGRILLECDIHGMMYKMYPLGNCFRLEERKPKGDDWQDVLCTLREMPCKRPKEEGMPRGNIAELATIASANAALLTLPPESTNERTISHIAENRPKRLR